jgi:hypothetical protein
LFFYGSHCPVKSVYLGLFAYIRGYFVQSIGQQRQSILQPQSNNYMVIVRPFFVSRRLFPLLIGSKLRIRHAHASSGLSPEFHEDAQKNTQWNAFIRKGMLVTAPPSLTDVCLFLETFLLPPTQALTQDQDFKAKWKPGGPWR